MPLGEFELIRRYFAATGAARADVILGVGDDGAVLAPPPGQQLIAVVDTLVEGTHFLPGSPPESIGHRALAVNLSDIAAMGATPAWSLLALTLPRVEERWLEGFATGYARLAQRHGVALVGGDTTRGPLSMTVQVIGFAPAGLALRRDGARAGDLLCVTGTPGDAAAGLELERTAATRDATPTTAAVTGRLRDRFLLPEPRLASGLLLRDFATACIDVSDGLLGDAGKLCAASRCGAVLQVDQLPLSAELRAWAAPARAVELALTGGDDYELCFTLPAARRVAFEAAWPAAHAARGIADPGFRVIGILRAEPGIEIRDAETVMQLSQSGFDHFAT
jgi:thiamine-monophosphate kinase